MVFLNVPRVFSIVLKAFKVVLDGSKCVCGGSKGCFGFKGSSGVLKGFQAVSRWSGDGRSLHLMQRPIGGLAHAKTYGKGLHNELKPLNNIRPWNEIPKTISIGKLRRAYAYYWPFGGDLLAY